LGLAYVDSDAPHSEAQVADARAYCTNVAMLRFSLVRTLISLRCAGLEHISADRSPRHALWPARAWRDGAQSSRLGSPRRVDLRQARKSLAAPWLGLPPSARSTGY